MQENELQEMSEDEIDETSESSDFEEVKDEELKRSAISSVPLVNLNGEVVIITDVKIGNAVNDDPQRSIQKTRDGTKVFKNVQMRVYYSHPKLEEIGWNGKYYVNYSGIARFENGKDEMGKTKWSGLVLYDVQRDKNGDIIAGGRKASLLKEMYAKLKKKDSKAVNLEQFKTGLIGLKAKIAIRMYNKTSLKEVELTKLKEIDFKMSKHEQPYYIKNEIVELME